MVPMSKVSTPLAVPLPELDCPTCRAFTSAFTEPPSAGRAVKNSSRRSGSPEEGGVECQNGAVDRRARLADVKIARTAQRNYIGNPQIECHRQGIGGTGLIAYLNALSQDNIVGFRQIKDTVEERRVVAAG